MGAKVTQLPPNVAKDVLLAAKKVFLVQKRLLYIAGRRLQEKRFDFQRLEQVPKVPLAGSRWEPNLTKRMSKSSYQVARSGFKGCIIS